MPKGRYSRRLLRLLVLVAKLDGVHGADDTSENVTFPAFLGYLVAVFHNLAQYAQRRCARAWSLRRSGAQRSAKLFARWASDGRCRSRHAGRV